MQPDTNVPQVTRRRGPSMGDPLNLDTSLQLDQFSKKSQKWREVEYVPSLWDFIERPDWRVPVVEWGPSVPVLPPRDSEPDLLRDPSLSTGNEPLAPQTPFSGPHFFPFITAFSPTPPPSLPSYLVKSEPSQIGASRAFPREALIELKDSPHLHPTRPFNSSGK